MGQLHIVTNFLSNKNKIIISIILQLLSFPELLLNSIAQSMVKSVNYDSVGHEFESRYSALKFIIFNFPKVIKTYFWTNVVQFLNSKPEKVF